jgi:hypothetical protein
MVRVDTCPVPLGHGAIFSHLCDEEEETEEVERIGTNVIASVSVLLVCQETKVVYLLKKNSFFLKVNFRKINYFLMFGSVMKNKLKNIF